MAKTSVLRELASDLRSPLLLPGLSIGVVVGLMVIVVKISFASMVFSGPMSVHVSSGIGMMLGGSLVFILVTTLTSRIRSVISVPQDAPTALFAVVATAIAASSANPAGQQAFITTAAALILSALATGLLFFLVGHFQLADLFRFMPYPVISGFLAGTGWLMTRGSFEVMTDRPLTADVLPVLFAPELLILWLPGLVYALVVFVLMRRFSSFLILPGSLVGAVLLYHAVLWMSGTSLAQAQQLSMLYRPFAETALWPAYRPAQFLDVDWGLIARQAPTLAVLPFISLIGQLLNCGGIELAARKEYDMNVELKVNGFANGVAGLAGGGPGYNAIGYSVMGIRTGANTRLVGLTVSLLLILSLTIGSGVLVLVPKAILGGFLLLLGFFFIFDWLVDTAKKMPRSDHFLVLLIFLIISVVGYMQGVLFGLLMTMLFFVIRFSRVPLIQDRGDLSQRRSHRVRPLPQQVILARHGSKAQLYRLSGYIFFGSVTTLINSITESAKRENSSAPAIIILDFQEVNGYDISSVSNFVRLIIRFAGQNVRFAFSATPDGFRELLAQNLDHTLSEQIGFFPESENALQWAEDWIISGESELMNAQTESGRTARDELFERASDDMLAALERQARVEQLIETCSPYLVAERYDKDALILRQSTSADGLYLVKSGVVVEQAGADHENPTLLRELGPGTAFAEPSAYGSFQSLQSYRAKTAVEVCVLSPAALTTLEAVLPGAALELHRLVIDRFLLNEPGSSEQLTGQR